MSKRRIRKGKIESFVPAHRWRNGKAVRHPGYWRKLRPKGKKKIIGKQYVLREVRDENGMFKGWKRIRR